MFSNLTINEKHGYAIFPADYEIKSVNELNDLLGNCYYNHIEKVLINENNLSDTFFDLKTKIAGDYLQKLVLYQFKAAFVISAEKNTGRFSEMVLESNKGNRINFFYTFQDAVNWLETI